MVYRHIYWGLLNVCPGPTNAMTKAVEPTAYLVKIIPEKEYETAQEAAHDTTEYVFSVTRGGVCLEGFEPGMQGTPETEEEKFAAQEKIFEEDWSRYRLIRLPAVPEDDECIPKYIQDEEGRPCGEPWEKLFPAMGYYLVSKAGYSVIGIPDLCLEGGCQYAGAGK